MLDEERLLPRDPAKAPRRGLLGAIRPSARIEGQVRSAREGAVEVRPLAGRGELNAFIKLPWQLYRGASNWIPPLLSERRRHLNRGHNPFFEHADAEYFLAWRGREPVGRISAH